LEEGSLNQQTHQSTVLPLASYPWVGQKEIADCGVAALAMVARFHGLAVSLPQLRQVIDVQDHGTSLLELQRAAESLAFRTTAVRIGAEQLLEAHLPAIAHLGGGHYVVIYGLGPEGFIVGDPAVGVVPMSPAAFQQSWTHQLLLLLPADRSSSESRPRR
jgi:ABC-type bacteriocin/lantibiotic exporter with double-glycine peptidase domain